jgi:hypothetical protein
MYDTDGVLRACVQCSEAGGIGVRDALGGYVTARTTEEAAFAEWRLRMAIVAQALGHEIAPSDDGARHIARIEAAERAMRAWDGPSDAFCYVPMGGRRVRVSSDLARRLGWVAFANGGGKWHTGELPETIAIAMSERLTGDDALLRAIAIGAARRNQELDARSSADERAAAGMLLAAARLRTDNHDPT